MLEHVSRNSSAESNVSKSTLQYAIELPGIQQSAFPSISSFTASKAGVISVSTNKSVVSVKHISAVLRLIPKNDSNTVAEVAETPIRRRATVFMVGGYGYL